MNESLANYSENRMCQQIFKKLEAADYESELDFVETLDQAEVSYLESVLKSEMHYARNVQDDIRMKELNEVYELLI